MAPRLDKKSKVNTVPHRTSRIYLAVALCFASIAAMLAAAPARAGDIKLPPEAIQPMDKMYSGDPPGLVATLRHLAPPPSIAEPWKRRKHPEDGPFLPLAETVIARARAQTAKSDGGAMRFH